MASSGVFSVKFFIKNETGSSFLQFFEVIQQLLGAISPYNTTIVKMGKNIAIEEKFPCFCGEEGLDLL